MKIKSFTVNPFQENTYVVYDDSSECIIIDPGCASFSEEKLIKDFITSQNLKPVKLINTHCHIDHILGNKFIAEEYELSLEAHKLEEFNITRAEQQAMMFGMKSPQTPFPKKYLEEGEHIHFGNTTFEIFFTPGHSPGHIVLFNKKEKILIGGDVLFRESIGRTDLPGGNYETLIHSILNKLFILENEVTVYSGHGPSTTIGHEKKHNPFLNDVLI